MIPGQGGLNEKLLGGQAETNPFGGQKSTVERWKIFAIVGVLLVGGTFVLQSFRADPTPEPLGIGGKPASKPATLNPRAEKEAWIGDAAGRVRKIEEKEQQLAQKMDEFMLELRRKDEEIKKLVQAQSTPANKVASLAPSAQGAARSSIFPPPQSALPPQPQGGQAFPTSTARPTPPFPTPPSVQSSVRSSNVVSGQPSQPTGPVNRIRVFSPDVVPGQGPGSPTKYWIPTGTMLPVKLLTGLDAPGKSANLGGEPHPVLMFVEDMSLLPNNVQMDMRECYVLGEGMGDLSEERAKIRAIGFSCVNPEKKTAVDIKLRGVVTGEDGKIGLRGPIVQREGAILAKALLAGFVNGISRIFMPYQQGFLVSSSPQQAFNFPDPSKVGMAGVAGGMGGAAQVLARHYSQLAKDIYPIIEIDAGRQGMLIVTEGRELAEAPL